MIDRDKVIKGLECCVNMQRKSINRDCGTCPYNDDPELGSCFTLFPVLRDALALLKADQAHLMRLRYELQMIADDANLYDEYLAECAVRRLVDEMRDIAPRGVPEEVTVDAE